MLTTYNFINGREPSEQIDILHDTLKQAWRDLQYKCYNDIDAVRIRYFGILPNFWVSEKGFFLAWKERVFVGWHSKLGLYFSDFIRKQWKYTPIGTVRNQVSQLNLLQLDTLN